jgi:hypothetical protein
MYEYLGTVRNIAAGRSMLDLLVYDDGIVVGRGDLRSMMLKVAGTAAFGGLGFGGASQATDALEQQRAASTAISDRVELLALHPDNRFIPSDTILAVQYSHPWFPPIYRIDLELSDGRTERFEWKRIHNEPKAVAALLRRAFGVRLITERI